MDAAVLIVGAGPVGLQLALDLGWRGVNCVVIDSGDGSPVLHPRAAHIASRTMEFCRRWGIADDIVHAGFPLDYEMSVVYCTTLAGHLVEKQFYPSLADQETPAFTPQNKFRCPQPLYDPILCKAVRSYPHCRVLYRHRLDFFEQGGHGVRAVVVDEATGKRVEVAAQYLVGCDGVNSGVARELGIAVEGNAALSYSVNAVFRCPKLNDWHDKGDGERYLFLGPTGTWANMTVVDGRELWRFTLVGSEEKMDLGKLDIAREIHRAFGRDGIPFEIKEIVPWRRSELIATRYRKGRAFIAGDAAHTMSPTGGMGMNTGAVDAANLGWKLAAVLQGWGGEELLDTYELEQRPLAIRNAKWSSGNFKTWISGESWARILDESPQGDAARREIGAQLKASLRIEWESWGVQLGYRYDQSPLSVSDGTSATADDPSAYVQTARPGSRAPHAWLADGRSMLDLFGHGFVLLRFDPHCDVTALQRDAADRRVPLQVVNIDVPEIARLYEHKLVLVRPDGHVAWRADAAPAGCGTLIDTVRGAGVANPVTA